MDVLLLLMYECFEGICMQCLRVRVCGVALFKDANSHLLLEVACWRAVQRSLFFFFFFF